MFYQDGSVHAVRGQIYKGTQAISQFFTNNREMFLKGSETEINQDAVRGQIYRAKRTIRDIFTNNREM
jgi:hypothetical protein